MPSCDCGTCCNTCGHDPECTSLQAEYRMDDAEMAAAADGVRLPRMGRAAA